MDFEILNENVNNKKLFHLFHTWKRHYFSYEDGRKDEVSTCISEFTW